MKVNKFYVVAATVSLLFLASVTVTATVFFFSIDNKNKTEDIPKDEIYVYVSDTEAETETEASFERLIKEHDGKIGIFDGNGRLLSVIETYVKTLPKSERDELKEGIRVNTEKELYSIMEAYSD